MRNFIFLSCSGSQTQLDPRERITSRGRVCSISKVTTGEEEGRQQECHDRTRHVVDLLDAFLC
jgi:hypothetical protein